MKRTLTIIGALAIGSVFAQGKDAFLLQQTQQEMQRVSGQVDVLQNNFEDLSRRIGRLEGHGDGQGLRAEIEALKAAIADLRRQLSNQRGEIVRDLSGRIAKMQPAQTPAPAPKPRKPAYTGPCSEYTVQPGDSLYMVAVAFKTSVSKLREMNNLKGDTLRAGQKLLVPRQ